MIGFINDDDDMDFDIGYKKPPKHSQFKKGKSGNPKGRPKQSSKDTTMLEYILKHMNIEVPVQDKAGDTHMLAKKELIAATLVNDAIKGKSYAIKQLFNLGGNPENILLL